MFVKKIKRICSVRGCKNTEVFAISKTKDLGNSVVICKDCLKEALASIENYSEPVKKKTVIRPLFYHPEETKVTLSSVATKEPKPKEVIGKVAEEIPIAAEDKVTGTDTIKLKVPTNVDKKLNKDK